MSRPLNCFITFITIVVACFICGGGTDDLWQILVGGVVGVLVTAAGNIINCNGYWNIKSRGNE